MVRFMCQWMNICFKIVYDICRMLSVFNLAVLGVTCSLHAAKPMWTSWICYMDPIWRLLSRPSRLLSWPLASVILTPHGLCVCYVNPLNLLIWHLASVISTPLASMMFPPCICYIDLASVTSTPSRLLCWPLASVISTPSRLLSRPPRVYYVDPSHLLFNRSCMWNWLRSLGFVPALEYFTTSL